MLQFAIRATPGRFSKNGRWNRCGFRFKRTRIKKKNIPSQDSKNVDMTKSEIYCPLINHNKITDQEALSSFLLTPLSLDYSSKIHKDGRRIYLEKFHSVTSILNQTKPASQHFALKNWRKAQIFELGEEQFKEKSKAFFTRGSQFHHDVQTFLKNKETPCIEDRAPNEDAQVVFENKETPSFEDGASNKGYWQSISHVLQDIKNVVAIESSVVHPLLGYGGTVDLIAEYKGALRVIDWKTSAKHKTNLKDCFSYPQQVVAYAGAVNFDNNYPFQVCDGLIVIAYENGDPADVHHLSREMCEAFWLEWLMRLEQYRIKFPEHNVSIAYLRENGTDQELSHAHDKGSMAASQGAKYLSSIGVPVAQLGTVIKDEDLIEEEKLSSKDQQPISEEQSEGFKLWPTDTWKTAWKNILEHLHFRGKN